MGAKMGYLGHACFLVSSFSMVVVAIVIQLGAHTNRPLRHTNRPYSIRIDPIPYE